MKYTVTNFWEFFCSDIIEYLFSSKEDKIMHKYMKNMKKLIESDLKYIDQNNENNVTPFVSNNYYNILVKGNNVDKWRVYFLRDTNAFVVFPLPNNNIWIAPLTGGSYYHKNSSEPDERSKFILKSWSLNFMPKSDLKLYVSDLDFIDNWISNNTDYDVAYTHYFTDVKENKFVKLKLNK